MQKQPLILTLALDADSQPFFNAQRQLYFPRERNYLDAHLTLFHQLPDELDTLEYFAGIQQFEFDMHVVRLMNLGAGVAYNLESPEVLSLHKEISRHFADILIPQDKQPLRPHITVMNKSTPEKARALLAELSNEFEPFKVKAIGLELWIYENGPWKHYKSYKFR